MSSKCGLEQKQRIILIIPVIIFLSIVMTELGLWSLINLRNIYAVIKIFVLLMELLAIFLCVRLYRVFNNPFFMFQSIALFVVVVNTGLDELRSVIDRCLFYNYEKDLYQIVSASMGSISGIVGLAGILLALYALLKYSEGWEQGENMSLVKRFNDLLPAARNSRLFWPVIIGVPLLLNLPPLLSSISTGVPIVINPLFCTAVLVARLLCLLLCLALVRVVNNNFFKFMSAVYLIPLGVMLFSYLNAVFGVLCQLFRVSESSFIYRLSNITFNYIAVFDEIVIAGLLLIALHTYRESGKDY